jgi:hypothetical protein
MRIFPGTSVEQWRKSAAITGWQEPNCRKTAGKERVYVGIAQPGAQGVSETNRVGKLAFVSGVS